MQLNPSGEHDLLLEARVTFPIGTLVNTIQPIAGLRAGIPGLVYHTEVIEGEPHISILLANGTDIGVFNLIQTEQMLEKLGELPLLFQFTTTKALMEAYTKGVFNHHFNQACIL